MKNYKTVHIQELSMVELIKTEGSTLFPLATATNVPVLPGAEDTFNPDWGWIGSGPGDQTLACKPIK